MRLRAAPPVHAPSTASTYRSTLCNRRARLDPRVTDACAFGLIVVANEHHPLGEYLPTPPGRPYGEKAACLVIVLKQA